MLKLSKKDLQKKYFFCRKLLLCKLLTCEQHVLMSDPDFASYTEMSLSPDKTRVAIGNIKGTLRILSLTGQIVFLMVFINFSFKQLP